MEAEIDERINALDTRLRSVEGWMESFKVQMTDVGNEVKANTRLTEETHGRSEEMYEFLLPARNFFKAIGVLGNGLVRVGRWFLFTVEFLGRLAKPVFWIIAICIAGFTYFKTGSWHMPDWWKWFLE